ncbi:MAG TPA: RagB/SusD family nutrient uptake outer membrane protein [Hanamia sp.]|nr:RagB/SusD family nutrient uptake outer membrane protein [Hanamia sp.]
MKTLYKILISLPLLWLITAVMCLFASCKVDPIADPNNPGLVSIEQNATLGEIQNVVDGTESGMRNDMDFYFDDVGVIGREFYRFATSDPRYTSELLGSGNSTLDNTTFYITRPFESMYRVVKNTNILIAALQNTKAAISDEERKVGIAYAKTIQAYEFLLAFNLEYGNGIRVDVANPDSLGPFLSKEESLNAIQDLLNTANTDLKSNTTAFPFNSSIFGNMASEFSKFNRALAARVAAYRKDWPQANTALSESFLNLTGSLTAGAYYLFSTAGGDLLNLQFYPLNSSGETRVVQPNFISEAEAGDTRVPAKTSKRTSAESQDGLSSLYDFYVYKTNDARIPIIRNEELILLYAEVQAQLANPTDAVDAINIIRRSASLGNYGGATDLNSLINEILKQRRYSLYGEGHRWIDMRRYDKLDELPIDRPGDDVWIEFPRPANE